MTKFPGLLRLSSVSVLSYRPGVRQPAKAKTSRACYSNHSVKELQELIKCLPRPKSFAHGPQSRISVVDEKLCDDALQSLAPSLDQFRGCDILDFFPGLGLWSSKVHSLLKPRCHTLLDINQDSFAPFLQALVDKPDSRYQYKSFDILLNGRNRRRAAYKDPFVTAQLKPDSPGHADRPLLILATCTAYPFRPHNYRTAKAPGRPKQETITRTVPLEHSPSEDLLHELMQHTSASDEHTTRPIRILLWTLDRDKLNYIPRTATSRKVAAFQVEEFFMAKEVVGFSQPAQNVQGHTRSAQHDIQSALTIARSMEKNQLTLPEDRRPQLYQDILMKLETTAEVTALERDLTEVNDLTARNALEVMSTSDRTKAARATTRNAKQIAALHASFEHVIRGAKRRAVQGKILDNIGVHILMIELERSIASGIATIPLIQPSVDAPGGFVARAPEGETSFSLDELSARCVDDLQIRRDEYLYAAQAVIDNYAAINRPSPLLVWDRRTSEPLECRPEDFYPKNRLALLDLQVRVRKPPLASYSSLEPKYRATPTIAALPFAKRLLRSGESYPLPQALDRMAHGCSEGILPACPSITDPLRGGRMAQNLFHLRVRMLTQEHWTELVAAWYAWPFRKSDIELESEMGSSTIFRDSDLE